MKGSEEIVKEENLQDFQSRAETGFIFLFCFVFVFVFVFVFMKALPIADCQGGRLLLQDFQSLAEAEQRASRGGAWKV